MSLGGDWHMVGVVGTAVFALLAACAHQVPPDAPAHSVPADDAGAETGAGDAREADDAADAAAEPDAPSAASPCPEEMVLVELGSPTRRRFCIDRYEASLVETLPDGTETNYPHYLPVDGHVVRAVSRANAFPQGYISEVQAQDACVASSKRLCSESEWKGACMGAAGTTFPYGQTRRPGVCHDSGKSAVLAVFGAKAVAASTPFVPPARGTPSKPAHTTKGRAAQSTHGRAPKKALPKRPPPRPQTHPLKVRPPPTRRVMGKKSVRPASVDPGVWARLNDPGLGQVEGAVAKTGEHQECVSSFGAFDMVGNLHEWIATDATLVHGTFAGGYYLDTSQNGDGCNYRTVAHAHDYHDYSTGFRCCADPLVPPGEPDQQP
jgi:hypothetical protein